MFEVRAKFQKNPKPPFDKRTLLKIVALAIQRRIMTSFSSSSTPGKPPAVRTGNLRANIAWVIHGDRLEMGVTRRAIYGIYLEKGTGIYGPRHAPIVPRRKKALKFQIGNRTVIVRSVKGIKKRPFIDPAISYVFRKMRSSGKFSLRAL